MNIQNNADMQTYLQNTHTLNDYNEIYGTNTYLDDKTSSEVQRLQQHLDRMRSTKLRMKQDYLLKKFAVHELEFNFTLLSVVAFFVFAFVVLLTMHMQNKLSYFTLFATIGLVSAVLFIAVTFTVMHNNKRKETNWYQFYWDPMNQKNKITWGEWWKNLTKDFFA
jgi:ABC-type lipoprotein release transport system permease subunit